MGGRHTLGSPGGPSSAAQEPIVDPPERDPLHTAGPPSSPAAVDELSELMARIRELPPLLSPDDISAVQNELAELAARPEPATLSVLEAVAVRTADAFGDRLEPLVSEVRSFTPPLSETGSLAPPTPEAGSLESLDANCLLIISRQCGRALPEGSCDERNVTLARLAQVSQQLRIPLSAFLKEDYRRHRRRKNSLTQLAQRLGGQGSWSHHLRRVRAAARAHRHDAQCGACRHLYKVSRMFQLLDDDGFDERQSRLFCASCTRLRYRLPVSYDPITLTLGLPFCTSAAFPSDQLRVELTDDYGEGGEAASALRNALCASGYGFRGDLRPSTAALCDADWPILCDLLLSGLGTRCLWIDLSDSAVGDAGLTALARGLPACMSLLHLNLNGTAAGDEGVAALAAALTPKPLSSLSLAARSLLPPQAPSEEWGVSTREVWAETRRGVTSVRSPSATMEVTSVVTCPNLRWLYFGPRRSRRRGRHFPRRCVELPCGAQAPVPLVLRGLFGSLAARGCRGRLHRAHPGVRRGSGPPRARARLPVGHVGRCLLYPTEPIARLSRF